MRSRATRRVQCGFCTPAMALTIRALLEAGELADEDAIRHGLAGNLCRCTGYRGIVEAVEELADAAARRDHRGAAPIRDLDREPRSAGRCARVDAAEKLRGQAQYVGDIVRPPDAPRQGPAQPGRARPHRVDRHRRRARHARRRRGAHRRGPAGHRPVLGPRDQGPADRGDRPGALRGRAGGRGRGRGRGDRGGRRRAIEVEYEELPGRGHARRGARARTRRCVHERPIRPGLFHGLGTLPRARRQRLLPVRHRPGRRGASRSRPRPSSSRATTRSRASTSTRWRRTAVVAQVDGGRHHALGDVPAPVPRARRDRRPVRRAARRASASSCPTSAAASAASRTRRWSPSRSRSRARPAGPCGS